MSGQNTEKDVAVDFVGERNSARLYQKLMDSPALCITCLLVQHCRVREEMGRPVLGKGPQGGRGVWLHTHAPIARSQAAPATSRATRRWGSPTNAGTLR